MTCTRCRKPYREETLRCPHCGEPNPALSGVFQTSTVLISAGGNEGIYRSVDEVPARLRTKLIKSTNGTNSATILIADRKGRKELAKAMRNLPGPAQRRFRNTILGAQAGAGLRGVAPKRAVFAAVLVLMLLVIAAVFSHRWDVLFR